MKLVDMGALAVQVVISTWNNGSPSPAFNNAAQTWNHTFYWESMSPEPQELSGDLKADIEATFGSVDDFLSEFSTAGATQFGSGWAWLVVDNGKLAVVKTPNAENPITSGKKPILVSACTQVECSCALCQRPLIACS